MEEQACYQQHFHECTSQQKISYAVITRNPKISVAYNHKGLFLTHVTCPLGIDYGPVSCFFHSRTQESKGNIVKGKQRTPWRQIMALKASSHRDTCCFLSHFINQNMATPEVNIYRESTYVDQFYNLS